MDSSYFINLLRTRLEEKNISPFLIDAKCTEVKLSIEVLSSEEYAGFMTEENLNGIIAKTVAETGMNLAISAENHENQSFACDVDSEDDDMKTAIPYTKYKPRSFDSDKSDETSDEDVKIILPVKKPPFEGKADDTDESDKTQTEIPIFGRKNIAESPEEENEEQTRSAETVRTEVHTLIHNTDDKTILTPRVIGQMTRKMIIDKNNAENSSGTKEITQIRSDKTLEIPYAVNNDPPKTIKKSELPSEKTGISAKNADKTQAKPKKTNLSPKVTSEKLNNRNSDRIFALLVTITLPFVLLLLAILAVVFLTVNIFFLASMLLSVVLVVSLTVSGGGAFLAYIPLAVKSFAERNLTEGFFDCGIMLIGIGLFLFTVIFLRTLLDNILLVVYKKFVKFNTVYRSLLRNLFAKSRKGCGKL